MADPPSHPRKIVAPAGGGFANRSSEESFVRSPCSSELNVHLPTPHPSARPDCVPDA